MTAFVQSTTLIGPTAFHVSVAVGDSFTLLQNVTVFNTNGFTINMIHADYSVFNMGSLLSANSYGVIVNGVNNCDIFNATTGTIGALASNVGFVAAYVVGNGNTLRNLGEIFSTNGIGATLNGNGNVLTNAGHISGAAQGVLASGDGYALVNSGTIEGGTTSGNSAVFMGGTGSARTLVNTGLIQNLGVNSGNAGVEVNAFGTTTIQNEGTIRSISGAAIEAVSGSGALVLINSGILESGAVFGTSVTGSNVIDTITNTGSINGDIALLDGNDIFDGIGGHVGGTVLGGGGNDTFRVSDSMARVFEAVGEGMADLIESTVSFSLANVGDVERLTLLGTAADGTGNALANTINGNIADNRLFGAAGSDAIAGYDGDDLIDGGADGDQLYGGAGNDRVVGRAGADVMFGDDGEDWLIGGIGNDTMTGGEGDDTLFGGTGRDSMTGGTDADVFVFRNATDSGLTTQTRDIIVDFEAGLDVLDLSGIDAVLGVAGNQAFSFVGLGAFTGVAGQLRYFQSGNSLIVEGNLNNDLVADFSILLKGETVLAVDDLIL